MTSLTERYLAAVLRGIPERQRPDVERELRSSIADAIEDRASSGQDRAAAETAVLEGLGDPARLATGYGGSPQYLIGPELFGPYRRLLTMLLSIVPAIAGVVIAAVELANGGDYIESVTGGLIAAFMVGIQLTFWVTLVFALIERADAARLARAQLASSRWTVAHLPELSPAGVSAGETIGEVVTLLITIGGLLFLKTTQWFGDGDGSGVTILDPALDGFWSPALIALLVVLGALQLAVYVARRWTLPLATAHIAVNGTFAITLIVLALSGSLVNPAFAAEIGWPPLAAGNGWVMIGLAGGVGLVTAYEIADVIRRVRHARTVTSSEGLNAASP